MQKYHFLPEISADLRHQLINSIGSWRLEGLEPDAEMVLDAQLVALGQKTPEQAIQDALKRVWKCVWINIHALIKYFKRKNLITIKLK